MLNKISKFFSISRGQFFLINPFKSLKDNIKKILKKNFYFGFKSGIYETSYIDLLEDIEVLRSNLHSKWRNQLVKSEKNKIEISIYDNDQKLDFILSSYNEMINKKNFAGLSITELKTLLKIYIKEKKFVSLIVSDENKNIIMWVPDLNKTGGFSIFDERDEEIKNYDANKIEKITGISKKGDEILKIVDKKIAIKIDVERHELSVLQGMQDLIIKNKIILQIELFDKRKENIEKYLKIRKFKKIKVIQKDHYFTNF